MNTPLSIIIDHRERRSGVGEALRTDPTVSIRFETLPVGDYRLPDGVLFERKTAADFAVSLFDGRLFSQAARLVRDPSRPCLILEGEAKDWAELDIRREALQGALTSLTLIFDLPVLRARNPEETARLIRYAGRQLRRAGEDGVVPIRKVAAKRRSTRRLRVLQSLPGVGPARAKALLEHFGSVRCCLAADSDDLAAVEGVGQEIARRIVETVEESPGQYGAPRPDPTDRQAGRRCTKIPAFQD